MTKSNGMFLSFVITAILVGWVAPREHTAEDETQSQVVPVTRLTLNDATNLAIDSSPELRQISWRMEKVLADGFQQSRLTNPQIGTVSNEIGNEGSAGQYGFFLSRKIVRNQRVSQIQNEFEWRARSLEAQHENGQRKIAFQVAKHFIQLGFLDSRIKLTKKKQVELTNFREVVSTLEKGGEIGSIDLNRVEIELLKVEQERKLLNLELTRERQLLATLVQLEPNYDLQFSFDEEVKLVLNAMLQREISLDDHPSLLEIQDLIEAQRWQVQVAHSRKRPDWQLATSVNYDFAVQDYFGGFQLNIPLQINDKKTGLIASSCAEVQILKAKQNETRLRLDRKLIKLQEKRQSLVYQMKNLRVQILPKIDEVAKQTTKLFRAGEVDFREVNLAILRSFLWREKELEAARDLLLVEAETETLILD